MVAEFFDQRRVRVLPKRIYEYESSENFSSLLDASNVFGEGKNSVIEGVVKGIDSRYVTMDVSMKNDGRVHVEEFVISGEFDGLAIGNKYDVFIDTLEDQNGYVLLSREKALKRRLWPEFVRAKEAHESIEGVVCGKIKGGLVVNIMGVLAFLPGSQVGLKPVRDLSSIAGVKQLLHIISLNEANSNIVVSRKSVFEESRLGVQDEALANIHEGQVLEGVVKNLTKYGAFIDLGNIDGLLHQTDISWKRVSHPSEALSVGQKVTVQVIKVNRAARRVSLGIKQLSGNPWMDIATQYNVGDRLIGHVTNTTDYGVFVEIKPGIEGLVYISEISWTKFANSNHPNVNYKKGQEVEVMILGIEQDKQRISLSIKQCCDNPWVKFFEVYKVGDVIEGVVSNMTDFGVFVTLDGKIDGLVHISDISWKDDSNDVLSSLVRQQVVKAKILSVDVKKGRVGLGIKQVDHDPVEQFIAKAKVGDTVRCKVVSIGNDHLSVSMLEDPSVVISVDASNLGGVDNVSLDSILELKVSSVTPELRQIVLAR